MENIEVLEIEEKPKKKIKLKLWVKLLISIVLIMTFIISAYSYLLSSVKNKSEIVEFSIDSGMSVYSTGKKLEKEGIIKSLLAYKVYIKLHNINSYKTGIYKLDKSYNTKDIVAILTGNSYKEKGANITFKEGKTIRNVAKVVAKKTDILESEFYKTIEDEQFIDELINKYWFLTEDIKNKDIYYSLEGYLFPETYQFKENVTAKDIVITMLNQTDKVLSKYKEDIDNSSYTVHQLVTLASIIEKEGIYDKDRKDISAVFYNRLNKGMSLGSDVTTYYALKIELGQRDLTTSEFNTENPYNTRAASMAGKLPIGPISNFGKESLDAAINPNKNDYYYFVADKKGKTHFTKTYEEHQKVIKELKSSGNWIEL